jgi:F-type H+-transporting ATPase subunit epsilon
MVKNFQVGIYSAEQILYEGQVTSLIVPSESGYLGILADHTPVVAKLGAGKITLRLSTGSTNVIESFAGGFLEILRNQVTLLL